MECPLTIKSFEGEQKNMTTKQAFKTLLETPSKLEKLNLNPSTLRTLKKRVRDNKLISEKKMEELLLKSGSKKIPEKWTL